MSIFRLFSIFPAWTTGRAEVQIRHSSSSLGSVSWQLHRKLHPSTRRGVTSSILTFPLSISDSCHVSISEQSSTPAPNNDLRTETNQPGESVSCLFPCSFFCFCVFKVRCDVKVIQNMLDTVPFFDFMFLLVSVFTPLFPVLKIRSSYLIMVHCYRLNYTAKRSQIK